MLRGLAPRRHARLQLGPSSQKKWRIGFLHPGQSALVHTRVVAFREGLGASGLKEASDAEVLVRSANDQTDRLPTRAVELIQEGVRAICAVSPPAVRAAREATRSVPIVAMDLELDPVANGWAASLARPGANITGIFLDLPASTPNRCSYFARSCRRSPKLPFSGIL